MNKPKVSVVVIYNNKQNLEDCIKSIINQTFSNLEIICVNNAAKDNSFEIVQKFANTDERIKLINLPAENDIEYAKRVALGVADTDYVCFFENNTVLKPDYIKDLYLELAAKQCLKIETGKLYKRNYLESSDEVNDIISKRIEEKIKAELERQSKELNAEKEALHKEWDNLYQINADNIKDSSYELQCRFNQLEKNMYDKDSHFDERIQGALVWHSEQFDDKIHKIYEDISKIYDYIKSEINQKGMEINHVYEEISKNYGYTEQIAAERTKNITNSIEEQLNPIKERLDECEKELTVRYVNLKRLMDTQLDEFKVQLNAISGNPDTDMSSIVDKTVSENIDNLYENINKLSTTFYEEISKLYSDINNRINKDKEDLRYRLEQNVSELRQDFASKISAIDDKE